MQISVDDSELQRMLDKLDEKNLRKITKAAFRSAGNVIKSQAIKNFKAQFPGSERWRALVVLPFRKGDGAYVKRQMFKRMSLRKLTSIVNAVEKAGGTLQAAKSATYGSYVLGILDGGTGPRSSRGRSRTVKSNRGKVRAYRFFESAVRDKASAAERKFVEIVEKKLKKINNE